MQRAKPSLSNHKNIKTLQMRSMDKSASHKNLVMRKNILQSQFGTTKDGFLSQYNRRNNIQLKPSNPELSSKPSKKSQNEPKSCAQKISRVDFLRMTFEENKENTETNIGESKVDHENSEGLFLRRNTTAATLNTFTSAMVSTPHKGFTRVDSVNFVNPLIGGDTTPKTPLNIFKSSLAASENKTHAIPRQLNYRERIHCNDKSTERFKHVRPFRSPSCAAIREQSCSGMSHLSMSSNSQTNMSSANLNARRRVYPKKVIDGAYTPRQSSYLKNKDPLEALILQIAKSNDKIQELCSTNLQLFKRVAVLEAEIAEKKTNTLQHAIPTYTKACQIDKSDSENVELLKDEISSLRKKVKKYKKRSKQNRYSQQKKSPDTKEGELDRSKIAFSELQKKIYDLVKENDRLINLTVKESIN